MKFLAPLFIILTLGLSAGGARAQQLDDRQLDDQRGGFISAGGFVFGFGADVRTFVDGSLALESKVTWTGEGVSTSAAMPMNTALVPGMGGATTIVHDLTDGQIRSLVSNTANNRFITQDTSVTIALPGFDQMQQGLTQQRLVSGLQSAVGLGLRDAGSH